MILLRIRSGAFINLDKIEYVCASNNRITAHTTEYLIDSVRGEFVEPNSN